MNLRHHHQALCTIFPQMMIKIILFFARKLLSIHRREKNHRELLHFLELLVWTTTISILSSFFFSFWVLWWKSTLAINATPLQTQCNIWFVFVFLLLFTKSMTSNPVYWSWFSIWLESFVRIFRQHVDNAFSIRTHCWECVSIFILWFYAFHAYFTLFPYFRLNNIKYSAHILMMNMWCMTCLYAIVSRNDFQRHTFYSDVYHMRRTCLFHVFPLKMFSPLSREYEKCSIAVTLPCQVKVTRDNKTHFTRNTTKYHTLRKRSAH